MIPHRPDRVLDPLGAYGRAKAAGEEGVEQVLGGSGRSDRAVTPGEGGQPLPLQRLSTLAAGRRHAAALAGQSR